ncbi:MAG: hypothetical protein QOI22_1841 [Verrucomicrobiota bacterium]
MYLSRHYGQNPHNRDIPALTAAAATGGQPKMRKDLMKPWAIAISTIILWIAPTGFACGPTGTSSSSTTTTTSSDGVVITGHKQKLQKRVIILGRERTNERRIGTADSIASEFLGSKPYTISDEERLRRQHRDIEFYALKKQLGNINTNELEQLNQLVKQELRRRGH